MTWRNPLRTGAVLMSLMMSGSAAMLSADRVAAEPPAPQSLTDVAGAIGGLLRDIGRSLRSAAAAA